jgi:hypothetical protein
MANKILNWLLDKQKETKEIKPVTENNAVAGKQKLLDTICEFCKPFFGTTEFTETVVVWVNNSQLVYQSFLRSTTFATELRTELQNRQLIAVSKAKFEFKTENPPAELDLPEIAKGVYIQLVAKQKVEKQQKEVFTKAKLSISAGKGSLTQNKYILDAKKQTEYNIGRGTDKNHIVIKDNDLENNEINSRVSRAHARIVFVVDKGFYLQSRNEQNRTIINRNNQRFADLKDLNTKVLLQDSDEIELGKSVCLKFKIVAENIE